MDTVSPENNQGSMRERELEVEIARLNAELAVFQGGDEPAEIAARFLTMAASTVDMAMADARREADELVVEVTAEAEARRDEATRVAEQFEAHAEALRAEAEHQQAVTDAARDEAQRMKAAATEHINAERARVAEEVERLAEVRTALESERSALETYHEELKRRVQELAESMVSFMTTEPPLAAVTVIDELAAPAIEPAAEAVEAAYAYAEEPIGAATPEAPPVEEAAAEPFAPTEPVTVHAEPGAAEAELVHPEPVHDAAAHGAAEDDQSATDPFAATQPEAAQPEVFGREAVPAEPMMEPAPEMPPPVVDKAPMAEMIEPATEVEATVEPLDADAMVASIFERNDEPTEPPARDTGLFASALAEPVPSTPVEPSDFYDAPGEATGPAPSFADMLAGAIGDEPEREFDGVPVVDTVEQTPTPTKGGLFSRVRKMAEAEPVEPVLPEAPKTDSGLFGSQASRLIEQTSPEQLASALADDTEEDARFRSFLDGDGDNDPSRDWLLRPDED